MLDHTKDNRIADNLLERCGVAVLFSGKANEKNTLQGNRYQNDRLKIGRQQDAEQIEKTNQLDGEMSPRK